MNTMDTMIVGKKGRPATTPGLTRVLALGLSLGLLGVGLTGCQSAAPMEEPVAIELPVVTPLKILGTASAEMGGPSDYTFTLVTSEVDLPPAVYEQGLEVNFEVHDVVLIGMGDQPSSGYGVEITGVQQVEDVLFVEASFRQPDGPAASVVTQPWAAAAIYKRKPGMTLRSDFD